MIFVHFYYSFWWNICFCDAPLWIATPIYPRLILFKFFVYFWFCFVFMLILKSGESCLHAACKYGHNSTVQYLTTTHTNLDAQDMVIFLFLFCVVHIGFRIAEQLLISATHFLPLNFCKMFYTTKKLLLKFHGYCLFHDIM